MTEKTKEKPTKSELAKKPMPTKMVQLTPESLISQAIAKGTDVATMEKLLAMRRELKSEWAQEQFNNSMADFQAECPVIKKEKAGGKTNAGEIAYHYAPLDSIVSQTKELIQKHGFSYMVKSETNDKGVKVTCIVKHTAGHSEESSVEVPLSAGTKVMSAPQIVAAALTFAKRYAFCNAFGILTGDDDNDAKGEPKVPQKKSKFDEMLEKLPKVKKDQLDTFLAKINDSAQYTDEQKQVFAKKVEELKAVAVKA